MTKKSKISLIGKIIVIAASILSIIMISGKWLDLYQVPMIFGKNIPHEYSLHDISDFLDTFNMYIDDEALGAIATFFSVSATVVVILNVLNIILILVNTKAVKASAILAAIVGVIVTAAYLFAVNEINAEMKEATYGGIKELLRTTSNPYWLIAFSILSNVGCRLKKKDNNFGSSSNQSAKKQICTQCGAETEYGSAFCSSCGAKFDMQTTNNNDIKFCTNGGAKMSSETGFCTECGNKVE